MEVLDLKQGSDEWLEARLNFLCASEAPAMMNVSKFMTRNQLLDLKKGWKSNPDSSFKKSLFEKGHLHEDQAREIIELEECEDLPPVVGLLDGKYLASFDGYNANGMIKGCSIWEHKDYNAILAENLRNLLIDPLYYWQLEHQCLVAGVDEVLFTCSDGTDQNRVSVVYLSEPEKRVALIAGWKQFETDLEKHELKAKQEAVIAKDAEAFPMVEFKVVGTEIISNINECVKAIKDRASVEMARTLETDQDFADKDKLNKATKEARERLKLMVEKVQGEFVSFADFAKAASEIDSVLQKMQSQGEAQVKKSKEAKKQNILEAAEAKIQSDAVKMDKLITPIKTRSVVNFYPDFLTAMKNKRTIESIQNAVDSVVAEWRIVANETVKKVLLGLQVLRENASEYPFLFKDSEGLVLMDKEPLEAVIKQRIQEHKDFQENLAKEKAAEEKAAENKAAEDKLKQEKATEELAKIKKEVEPNPEPVTEVTVERQSETPVNEPEPDVEVEDQILNWLIDEAGIRQEDAEFIVNALLDGDVPHLAVI